MILDKQAALPSKSRYDIIIAGGGMVGLSLACALAIADKKTNAEKSQPLSILLVDNFPLKRPAAGAKKPPPTYHPSFDARSTALSLASIEIYQTMGLLPSLLQHAEAIRQIHVSDRGHTGSTLLDAEEQDKAAFGYVIENQWLGAVLLDCMADLPAIELVAGASVANIKPIQGGATVEVSPLKAKSDAQSESLQPPQTIEACLLVVADGAQSGLRKSLGISASVKQYQQQAVIANIQTQLPHHGQAFERFTSDGAVAFLPLADLADAKNRSALVWTVPASASDAAASVENSDNKLSAQALAELSEQDFIAELQAAFGFRLGAIERVGQRQFYPLALTLSDEVYRNLMTMRWQPSLQIIPHYESEPLYIEALANSIENHLKTIDWIPDVILSSYHGITQKYFDKGDPYQCYCHKTNRLLIEKFGTRIPIELSFQSRFGPASWLRPYTDKTLERLAKEGKKNIIIIYHGFSSDRDEI